MSKERAKGTRGENGDLSLLRIVFPEALRTGSNHHTPWGPADFQNVGPHAIESKKWDDPYKAIRRGWPQTLKHIATIKKGNGTEMEPVLLVSIPHKGTKDGLLIVRKEYGIKLLASYYDQGV